MSDTSTSPAPLADEAATTWLWQRDPDSGELEKCLIPARIVPQGWLEPMQRRYEPGDRVLYRMHDDEPALPGTIAQDQGMYVAIDGDRPGSAATVHKTDVEPVDGREPQHVAEAAPDPVTITVSPDAVPELCRGDRDVTARWSLGPAADGWERQATLHVDHVADECFRARLRVVEARQDGGHREQRPAGDEVALEVHHLPSPRFSKKRLTETYQQALAVVRRYVAAGDPVVVAYFRDVRL